MFQETIYKLNKLDRETDNLLFNGIGDREILLSSKEFIQKEINWMEQFNKKYARGNDK